MFLRKVRMNKKTKRPAAVRGAAIQPMVVPVEQRNRKSLTMSLRKNVELLAIVLLGKTVVFAARMSPARFFVLKERFVILTRVGFDKLRFAARPEPFVVPAPVRLKLSLLAVLVAALA